MCGRYWSGSSDRLFNLRRSRPLAADVLESPSVYLGSEAPGELERGTGLLLARLRPGGRSTAGDQPVDPRAGQRTSQAGRLAADRRAGGDAAVGGDGGEVLP